MQAVAVSLCAALSLTIAEPAPAQSNLRIGFVNINYLLQNAPQTQAVNATLTQEFGPREAQLLAQQEALQAKADSYQRDAAVMPETERANKVREIEREQIDLQRAQGAFQEDVEMRQNQLGNELQANIARRVQAFAVAQGYDLIVTSVLYASDTIDITDEVFAALSSGANSDAAPDATPPEE
jgi:outer membrane protein